MEAGSPRAGPTAVYLELGKRRVFACALEWPGWCRSGRSQDLALDALASYVPRGGGRDRDKIIEHVLGDTHAVAALRAAIVEVLTAPSDGTPPVPKGWPPRYAVRRVAWHVLDHAWEIEDRGDIAGQPARGKTLP